MKRTLIILVALGMAGCRKPVSSESTAQPPKAEMPPATTSTPAAPISTTIPSAATKLGPKLGTVDMQHLFLQYHRTKEVQKELDAERVKVVNEDRDRQKQIIDLEQVVTALRKEMEDPTASDAQRTGVFKTWQSKEDEGVRLDQERRELLQRKGRALNELAAIRMKEILGEIQAIVQTYAKNQNYDTILDKSSTSTTQVSTLLYSQTASDITPDILKNLNQGAPGGRTGDSPSNDEK